jgi:hypothetical protein
MVDSTLGALAVLFLAGVILIFVNPIVAILPLLLIFALLGVKAASGLFKHAAPPADTSGEGVGAGPATPTSAEASYSGVADPGDRGV